MGSKVGVCRPLLFQRGIINEAIKENVRVYPLKLWPSDLATAVKLKAKSSKACGISLGN